MSSDTKTPNFIFASGHPNPIKVGMEDKRFFVVEPVKPGTEKAVCHGNKLLALTEDGLTEQFRNDLENYLAETFCSILPAKE